MSPDICLVGLAREIGSLSLVCQVSPHVLFFIGCCLSYPTTSSSTSGSNIIMPLDFLLAVQMSRARGTEDDDAGT
ncbi:hypothetical protein Csa_012862 [Cucumis sativus]|uniref:Uncharacterized protein n=1 Tax=Cucumis sativus TaxID=3659 RepID=A0A0A0KYT0_CUCSA|nr:hypothetical protein Csa_012862 [Cucumis sativus]